MPNSITPTKCPDTHQSQSLESGWLPRHHGGQRARRRFLPLRAGRRRSGSPSTDEWLNDWAIQVQASVTRSTPGSVPKTDPELEQWFREKADAWRRETAASSVIQRRVMHPAYQSIMTKGEAVLPLILNELRQKPDYWFWALEAITDENPVGANATVDQAITAWINWGKGRKIID